MNHDGVAMGRKRLVQKRLDSGGWCAFGDMRAEVMSAVCHHSARRGSGRKSRHLFAGCRERVANLLRFVATCRGEYANTVLSPW